MLNGGRASTIDGPANAVRSDACSRFLEQLAVKVTYAARGKLI